MVEVNADSGEVAGREGMMYPDNFISRVTLLTLPFSTVNSPSANLCAAILLVPVEGPSNPSRLSTNSYLHAIITLNAGTSLPKTSSQPPSLIYSI